ncbi:MAG: hypothetical protein ACYDDC_03260 [Thermoplasmataceae archaeon]
MGDVRVEVIGEISSTKELKVSDNGQLLIDDDIMMYKKAWESGLDNII